MTYMSIFVTQNQSGFGRHITYHTVIDDVSGIFPKTPIKVAGINAGRIKSIELHGSRAKVSFEIREDVVITEEAILRIKSVGFLGDRYLDINLGSQQKPRLPENAFIISKTGGGLENLTKDAGDVLKDLKAITGSIKEAVSPDSTEQKPLVDIIANIRDATANAKDMLASLKTVIHGNESKLNSMVDNMERLTKNLATETDAMNGQSLMSDLKKLGPILDQLKQTMKNVDIIVADVKNGKGTVGKLLRDDEVIDQVTETLSGVNKIVNRVNALKTELNLFSGINTDFGNQSGINLDILPAPERFYRLGLVTSEIGPANQQEINESITGTINSTTTMNRTVRDKNAFVFNAQIGRKIHNWGFRAGVIESAGGFGVDYYFRQQGSRLTFEAFDYRTGLGPNLRLLGEVHLWNVFYGRLALEDLISETDQQSLTVGAGLRFTDEDLKGLIGFFL